MAQDGHPTGCEPWGNLLLKEDGLNIRPTGAGSLSCLSDQVLLDIIARLTAKDIARLGMASKTLYCFAHHDDIWKGLTLEELQGDFNWAGEWRMTYLCSTGLVQPPASGQEVGPEVQPPRSKRQKVAAARKAASAKPAPPSPGRAGGSRLLRVAGFYSDLLYQPWHCATVPIAPSWLEVDNIERRSGLSAQQFRELYEQPNRPVVITDVVPAWPAFRKWDRQYVAEAYGGRQAIVGNAPMALATYFHYCDTQRDELPLYLFDKRFPASAPQLAADVAPPPQFEEDLFSVLGADRPDYRWLIMGPERSGSSFHVDPNATSAWNGVVTGSKKWILYPPHVPPPGVYPSADGVDVAAPVSIIEWFLSFYGATKEDSVRPVECVLKAGEMIFVPRGWWHCALNLEESIAVTQNYVSSVTLPHVLKFLKSCNPDLISGCSTEARRTLYSLFVAGLEQQRPDLYRTVVVAGEAAASQRQAQQQRLAALFRKGPTAAAPGTSNDADLASAANSSNHSAAQPERFTFGFNL